jgi:4-hydroxythreonine-4-phosphate dehydrogenase
MPKQTDRTQEGLNTRPAVAITMGDPCGVGPEIIVKAFDSPRFAGECSALVVGERLPLERAIKLLGSSAEILPITGQMLKSLRSGALRAWAGVIPLFSAAQDESPATGLTPADIEFGKPTPAACEAAVSCIRTAAGLACAGSVDAVCTCPINKEQLHRHGFPFPGHTEFLRELTGAEDVVMMLAGPSLKVALATIHESLADVPGLLTKELLHKVIRITVESMLRDFGMKSPRIAVAGLNPHAGEAGKFGREEIEVIRPVIEQFEAEIEEMGRHKSGFYPRISGPWPPDTVFHRAVADEFDAVVAMYHDQGLIPVKLAHFNDAVNVSLGLPIVRTSVDHGTAYDIAGTGTAEPGSLMAAVSLAAAIARNRKTKSDSPQRRRDR